MAEVSKDTLLGFVGVLFSLFFGVDLTLRSRSRGDCNTSIGRLPLVILCTEERDIERSGADFRRSPILNAEGHLQDI